MNKSKLMVQINNDLDWKLFRESKLAKGHITVNDDFVQNMKDTLVSVMYKDDSNVKNGIIIWPMGGRPSLADLRTKKNLEVLIKKIN